MVPLFPEMLPLLAEAFELAEPGTVHVISKHRNRANLRTRFQRIIKRAGLTPWPKLFQNLRSTRQTELEESYPSHVVCAWIGNSEQVARKHYLQVTDEHFDRAANPRDAQNDASVTHIPTSHTAAENRTDPRCKKETPAVTGVMPIDAKGCDPSRDGRMEDRGLESGPFISCKTRNPPAGAAQCAALNANLVWIIQCWAALPEAEQQQIADDVRAAAARHTRS